MLFNSIEFAIFLPIVFLLYWFVFNKVKVQNLFVLLASYVFYGWWDWRFLFLIILTSFCSWGSGLLIQKRSPKFWLWTNIVVNLGILGFFKYFNFFVQSCVDAFALCGITLQPVSLQIILPVGISFYTFQALSYSIDVYKNRIKPTQDIVAFFAYVSFFPQLVAGPIERATNLLPQFQKSRMFDYATAVDGCRQILWGLFKKIVIADNCAEIVNHIFANYETINGCTLLLGGIFFTFQIYGDFSGYSDIAIGVAKLFGFSLMDNFKTPYFSRDIAEFWRRWHISLTTWFRDYVYIPLGGSRTMKAKIVRNTFVIFLVSGFWHGANWTFVVWGAYNACLFLPLILRGKNRKYTNVVAENGMFPSSKEVLHMTGTFILIVVGWIIFRSETIADAIQYFGTMFDGHFFDFRRNITVQYRPMVRTMVFIGVMAIMEWLFRKKRFCLDFDANSVLPLRLGIYYVLLMLIFMFGAEPAQFIYFQF